MTPPKNFLGSTILVITAHPDDESFSAAGAIAQNHEHGGKTFIICASHGERGMSHLKIPTTSNMLAATRKRELHAAARFLHVSKTTLLKLPDGGISDHLSQLLKKSLHIARSVKPNYIMSFGPDGITGHRDHIAVGEVAKKVAHTLDIPLICFALPPRIHRQALRWLRSRRAAGHYAENIIFQKPTFRIPLNPAHKKKALSFHRSQMDGADSFTGFPAYAVKELLKAEYFVINI